MSIGGDMDNYISTEEWKYLLALPYEKVIGKTLGATTQIFT